MVESKRTLLEQTREKREYRCCVCGKTVLEKFGPLGWFNLSRYADGVLAIDRIGLMCSLPCLHLAVQRAFEAARPGTQLAKRDRLTEILCRCQ